MYLVLIVIAVQCLVLALNNPQFKSAYKKVCNFLMIPYFFFIAMFEDNLCNTFLIVEGLLQSELNVSIGFLILVALTCIGLGMFLEKHVAF